MNNDDNIIWKVKDKNIIKLKGVTYWQNGRGLTLIINPETYKISSISVQHTIQTLQWKDLGSRLLLLLLTHPTPRKWGFEKLVPLFFKTVNFAVAPPPSLLKKKCYMPKECQYIPQLVYKSNAFPSVLSTSYSCESLT